MFSTGSNSNKDRLNNLEKELEFNYSRSSGSGGQNVNKVSTKVQIK
jgi:protein subunit release factor B